MSLMLTPDEIVAKAEESGDPGLLGRHHSWPRVRLSELVSIQNGAAFKSAEFNTVGDGLPLIRIRDVGTNAPTTYYSGEYKSQYIVKTGDLLVGMDGDFRAEPWRGEKGLLNQRVCRIEVTSGDLDRHWLRHVIQAYLDAIWQETSSVTVKHLSSRTISQIPIPLPPLTEQQRIVKELESHLSRLDAGSDTIVKSQVRAGNVERKIIADAVGPPWDKEWEVRTVETSGAVDLGRQRHPDWHHGDHMRPYLRVANVFEDRLDLEDVMEMNFPPEIFDRFKLLPGDILLNEGQSPHLLGRPAMYRGTPEDIAFTNSLIRFRAHADVLPEWALMVFRHYMHSGRFTREVRITTNIAHLSAGRFKKIEFPVPSLDEQEAILSQLSDDLGQIDRLRRALPPLSGRAASLRKSLLHMAFSGELVDQNLADEPASIALTKIRDQQSVTAPRRRRKTTSAK